MKHLALLAVLLAVACTRGPRAMSQVELRFKGTHAFDGQFEDVYDAAYLALEAYEGKLAMADRVQGVMENQKVPFTSPAGWDGDAFRSYAVDVYQDGAKVAVRAIPRLWAGDRDVSEEPRWELDGIDGEDAHWERLFDGIDSLLHAWREVPELTVERSRGEVSVLGVRFTTPADWHSLELEPGRRQAVSQLNVHGAAGCPECPGGLNPTIVFEIDRRHPAPDAPHLERVAMEHALGPKVVEPEQWPTEDTPTGRKGVGQLVAGDSGRATAVAWHVWDAGELAWMVRAAAVCAPDGPASCEGIWDNLINGVVTQGRR
jgi:hypothetical protein